MKTNLILVFVIALFAAVVVQAAAPNAMTASNPTAEKWLSSASTYYGHADTLVDEDSLWLYKGLVPEIGKEYNLIFPLIDGGGSDSTYIYIYLDCYDGTTKIERYLVDSITTAPTVAAPAKVALPVGQTIFGTKYDVVLKTHSTDNGGVVVLNYTCGFKASIVQKHKKVTY